jgi:hypothetical protein
LCKANRSENFRFFAFRFLISRRFFRRSRQTFRRSRQSAAQTGARGVFSITGGKVSDEIKRNGEIYEIKK